jgi:hypothetical protein
MLVFSISRRTQMTTEIQTPDGTQDDLTVFVLVKTTPEWLGSPSISDSLISKTT